MQAARGTSLSSSDHEDTPSRTGSRPRHIVLFAVVALLAYLADLISKIVVVEHLQLGRTIEIVGDYFMLHHTANPGAAFSMGTAFTEVLTVIAIVAALVVLWVARRLGSAGWAVGLGFLLGGVLGNLTDRLFREPGPFRGHVVDFFMFPNFPVFNVADIAINLAAATIIIQALRGVRVDGRRHEDEPATDDGEGSASR